MKLQKNIFRGFSRGPMRCSPTCRMWCKQILISLLSLALVLAPQTASAYQAPPPGQPAQAPPPEAGQQVPYTQQTPDQLQQLVAPIALYPDSLVAQILAASTFPDQVVEADRWLQSHPDLKGDDLAKAVDQQPWDASVKALTAFPDVLGNMDKNLSWTSSLGDAYYNQQENVMDSIQVMRQRAEQAGNLQSTPQQTVTTQGPDIVIQPANPEVVYVPAYDPWAVYGYGIPPWPGWYPYPGIWFGGPYLSFGAGFGLGYFGGYGWGYPRWGFDWHQHSVLFNHGRYFSRSRTFYNRNQFYRGGGAPGIARNVQRGMGGTRGGVAGNRGGVGGNRGGFAGNRGGVAGNRGGVGGTRGGVAGNRGGVGGTRGGVAGNRGGVTGNPGGVFNRPGATPRPFGGNNSAARGFAQPSGQSGVRSGAFSGIEHGGQVRSFSSRGSSSFGGGGFHGGGAGGGFHGGGGGGGFHGGGGGHR